jgi:hypothetical protein
MISLRLSVALGLALAGLLAASAASVHGVVFDDRNANGVRDAGEPGLAGVAVSDGVAVVLSGADGRYEIAAADGATIFVVKPRGWRPPVNAQNLPQFYHRLPAGAAVVDFPLMASEEPDRFRALAFTDPQPVSLQEVGYLERTLVDGLAGARGYAFGVTLGDVVYDRHDLFAPINAAMARIGVPWYNLNGNHDLNLNAGDDRGATASFEAVYGPSTYAFHYGRALFVALNDVRYLGGLRYIGGLRADQFTFLENLLRLTPRDNLVLLMMHIPWFYPSPANAETFRVADRARLFALLQDRPHNFWLSGHTHYQRHVFYGAADGWRGVTPLHEANVAAACGGFWGGPADASGIPIATMWDGTPHGYAILTVDGADARVDYRAAREPADHQISVHAPQTARAGVGYVSYWANVFNGHDGWTVESRVDGRAWSAMRRVLEWDPGFAQAYLAQDVMAAPLPGKRLPDPTVCYHLWRAYLPADLTPGEHAIEVRATDPAGQVYSATRAVQVIGPLK